MQLQAVQDPNFALLTAARAQDLHLALKFLNELRIEPRDVHVGAAGGSRPRGP